MMIKKLMMMTSMLTISMNHPMSLGLMLMLQTTMACVLMTDTLSSPWYSYTLFISIVSGLMIMFLYMASIISNKKFKIKSMMLLLTLLILMSQMTMDNSMEMMTKPMENKLFTLKNENLKTTIKFFNMNKSMMTMIIMTTLFILLVSISNIAKKNEGPLKKPYV